MIGGLNNYTAVYDHINVCLVFLVLKKKKTWIPLKFVLGFCNQRPKMDIIKLIPQNKLTDLPFFIPQV